MATAKTKPSIGINIAGASSDAVAQLTGAVLKVLAAKQDQATIQAALKVLDSVSAHLAPQNTTISSCMIKMGEG